MRPLGGAGRVRATPDPRERSAHFYILHVLFSLSVSFDIVDEVLVSRTTVSAATSRLHSVQQVPFLNPEK